MAWARLTAASRIRFWGEHRLEQLSTVRGLFKYQSGRVIALGRVMLGVMFLFAVLIDHPWTLAAPSWATVAALAGLALLSTARGFVIFFTVMAEAGATNAMLVAPPVQGRVTVPTACALFPKEITTPPRKWVEARYNLVRWTPMPRGGHFAALEQPDLLVGDVREFFRTLRR